MEQAQLLSMEEVKKLLDTKPRAPAVTMYLPTHRNASPPHMSEDQIRLKNLRNRALAIIGTRDDGRDYEAEFSTNINELLEDSLFWENQTEGLLICARPGVFKLFHLPLDTTEYLAVADQFHLGPVFGLLGDMRDFYVLSVAQHAPALYRGNFYTLEPSGIELPATLNDALMIDEMRQKGEQQRSSYGVRGGFNGRGGNKHQRDEERQRFWRLIDQTLQKKMDKQLPLILMGTESEISEFRAITNYPKVLSGQIEGSLSSTNAHDIFKPALNLLKSEIVWSEHHDAAERFSDLSGQNPDMTGRDFAAISKSADEGRVDTLLLSDIRYTTDNVRDDEERVEVISLPVEELAQSVNATAREVWRAGGRIINLRDGLMPVKDSLMLAVMRY